MCFEMLNCHWLPFILFTWHVSGKHWFRYVIIFWNIWFPKKCQNSSKANIYESTSIYEFMLIWVNVYYIEGCGGTIDLTTGASDQIVMSGYQTGLTCTWLIKVNHRINLCHSVNSVLTEKVCETDWTTDLKHSTSFQLPLSYLLVKTARWLLPFFFRLF